MVHQFLEALLGRVGLNILRKVVQQLESQKNKITEACSKPGFWKCNQEGVSGRTCASGRSMEGLTRERERDRQTDRQTDRQRDRQRDMQAERARSEEKPQKSDRLPIEEACHQYAV